MYHAEKRHRRPATRLHAILPPPGRAVGQLQRLMPVLDKAMLQKHTNAMAHVFLCYAESPESETLHSPELANSNRDAKSGLTATGWNESSALHSHARIQLL